MVRYPMIVPAVCVWCWTALWGLRPDMTTPAVWCSLFGILVALVAVARGWNTLALHCACCALGSVGGMTIGRTYVAPGPTYDIERRVRAEGRVTDLRTSGEGVQRFVLEGEIDGADLPCMDGRVLVGRYRGDPPVEEGERVVCFGTMRRPDGPTLPGEISDVRVAASRRASFVVNVTWLAHVAPPCAMDALRGSVRRSLDGVLGRWCSPPVHGVMNALLVGDTDGVSVSAAEAFRRSGTYHMFSVSGSHVAVIMFLIGAVLSSIPFAWRMPIIITATGLYVWLSGSDPPAIRAAIMGTVFLVGRSIERRTLPVNTLCAATFAMVTIDPFLVRDTGMILSVMAVGAIVGLGPWWTRRMARHTSARWVRSILPALGVSMAASLGTMPLTAIEFGVIACAAPLANLVVVPLLSAALVCGALLVVADPIGCGQPVAWFATACIHLATGVAEVAARWAVIDAEQGAMASIAVALGAAWLWPLIAPTMFGVVARWSAAHMVAAGLVLVAPRSTFETVHAPRRHGTVVACVRKDTLLLLTIGGPNAPVDTRLLAWVRHWPGHVRSAGIGVWGRRMSGRITRIMVPTQHEHHTRIR